MDVYFMDMLAPDEQRGKLSNVRIQQLATAAVH
jgi:hypothetical protein